MGIHQYRINSSSKLPKINGSMTVAILATHSKASRYSVYLVQAKFFRLTLRLTIKLVSNYSGSIHTI